MQTAKEKIENLGTTAKEGMDKAKASTQEKMEKVTTRNPTEKEIAREKKDVKKAEAEMRANVARDEHRAEKEGAKQTEYHGGNTGYAGTGTPGIYDPASTGRTGRDYV